ncbi:FAD dependent oxidoreductase [Desulfovibrio sp. X2]|uniref:glycerol-3-phosphate dehydrogenase/oxidase n=1 Tax=Desulfovibrio sp. X2 TaxID=941449 RepID=UPI0003588995|nr:FAD-dependent oxidoreductase [Desulfovibrio sp. X2]EPR44374.1 FAD dependent oxidoreductase [Desulfovibrio sp. X2]
MNRKDLLARLKAGKEFDLLVVGGGATGCGVALDAATRGLDVALVERSDFASGTSSKSTKLVHGGVRYLEKAIKKLDREQFMLVVEGLHERGRLLRNAPHLAHSVRLLTPVNSFLEAAYVYCGLVLYDLLAGRLGLGRSSVVTRKRAKELFPTLSLTGCKAGIIYSDGQFNDARMAVTLARTANAHGAACLNHVEVTGLVREAGKVCGAALRDGLSGEEWTVRAKGVVNATGPFADSLRRMDDPAAPDILKVSSGIHIMLPGSFAPENLSLLIPRTEDGRVLFMIPWMGHVIFGTTDEPARPEADPVPTQADVDYLLAYARRYLNRPVERKDVLAAWSGLRPLVFAPGKSSTEELARTHVIDVSPSGLLTITGGKWTSYRRMAEDAVDKADEVFGLRLSRPCATKELKLLGSRGFIPGAHAELARAYDIGPELALSLYRRYGDEAGAVLELARETGLTGLLHPEHLYLEAEVVHAARNELARHVSDVLVRRLPLGLVNIAHAIEVGPRVAELMGEELGWDAGERESEASSARELLAGWCGNGEWCGL